ncbi:hypothetical protein [Streptomyces sp. NPDC101150]|uniref:hypothetical protein n=1 Tax=Streptomyces sp. NPDC101150 TaxID=3366114 RepID=UPI0037F24983
MPPRSTPAPPRGSCGECGCRISLIGPALTDGLCKPCRVEASAQRQRRFPPLLKSGWTAGLRRDWRGVPCGPHALPKRSVCARHLAEELELARAEAWLGASFFTMLPHQGIEGCVRTPPSGRHVVARYDDPSGRSAA